MIPRDKPCIYCGKRIYFANTERGWIVLDAAFTPFKKATGQKANSLYTNEGIKIPCIILPEIQKDEADGFAHMAHICLKKPSGRRRKPLTIRRLREESGYYD